MPSEFSLRSKKSMGGDEYYTPVGVVNMIEPEISKCGFKRIWCPFDKEESNYVQVFRDRGYDVTFGHIETGQDFFAYDTPPHGVECVVSNPPFSKRDAIFAKLFEWDIPFALVMNMNGLFDSRKRSELFRNNEFELFIPYGRMKFFKQDGQMLNQPNFQSIYVCHKIFNKQIVFSDCQF